MPMAVSWSWSTDTKEDKGGRTSRKIVTHVRKRKDLTWMNHGDDQEMRDTIIPMRERKIPCRFSFNTGNQEGGAEG